MVKLLFSLVFFGSIKLFPKPLNKSPNDCPLITLLGVSQLITKNYDLALNTLFKVVNEGSFNDYLEKLFLKLVEIADNMKDDYLYIIFSEKALDINPVNSNLRFKVGLKYLNIDKYDLALYHYKKYLAIQEDSGGLNNLAIAYSHLEMKAKEAQHLNRAITKKNDALPFANVAQKYLNEGFTDVANRLLKEAEELNARDEEFVERVSAAKMRLSKILEDEEKKEKEIIDFAETLHKFKLRH